MAERRLSENGKRKRKDQQLLNQLQNPTSLPSVLFGGGDAKEKLVSILEEYEDLFMKEKKRLTYEGVKMRNISQS